MATLPLSPKNEAKDLTFISALVSAQHEIKSAELDSRNPHFNSKYASLASVWKACREALHRNGIAVVQTIWSDQTGSYLKTKLLHNEGFIESDCPLLIPSQDMQKLGSALSYARRYGLASIVGIVEEDDDGNKAVEGSRPTPSHSPQEFRFKFGKLAGKSFSEVPTEELEGYISWLLKQDPKKNEWISSAYNNWKKTTPTHSSEGPPPISDDDIPF